jgi:hypothetical membrane protein
VALPTPASLDPVATRRSRAAGLMLISGSLIYLLAEVVAAAAWTDPPYSYTRLYISDLGVRGPSVALERVVSSPLAGVMNAGFFLFGIAYFSGVALLPDLQGRVRRIALILGGLMAFGGVLLALDPGDGGSPGAGGIDLHGAGALASILGGNALVILLGRHHERLVSSREGERIMVLLGCLGLVSFVLFLVADGVGATGRIGLIERLAVYPITIGFILAGTARLGRWASPGRAP